jgi:protein-L-isoaspartate(D-aspartate) O-methyltransferase
MRSNQELVAFLVNSGAIKTKKLKEAFLAADRINFVPEILREYAYEDQPLPIAQGQTISQPSTVAFMLELLDVKEGDEVLDIGAGSGWVSCLLGFLVGIKGKVEAFEINEEVGRFGKKAVSESGFENVEYTIGDAADFWKSGKFYNKIYSGAAFETIPENLKKNLRTEGVLVAPTRDGCIRRIAKEEKGFKEDCYSGFVFVPFKEK